ncbi:MAG: hypothetical protein ACLPP9_08605 [Smithella sp.]
MLKYFYVSSSSPVRIIRHLFITQDSSLGGGTNHFNVPPHISGRDTAFGRFFVISADIINYLVRRLLNLSRRAMIINSYIENDKKTAT